MSMKSLQGCRVWSGTTLRRASVQLSKPSDATYSGTSRLRSQTSSTWTIDDRRRAAGLSQQQLQGRRTPGSRDECRTAPDGRRPLDQAHRLEPLARL